MASNLTSSPEFHKGYKAEDIVTRVLRNEGYFVLILADYQERNKSGAPGARNQDEFLTLPDLDIAKNGTRGFVEVKYKTEPSYTRITQQYEHGIGMKSWNMYQQIKTQFGVPVFLAIYEGKSGNLFIQEIDELVGCERIYQGNKMDSGGMIFWPLYSFKKWGIVAELKGELYSQLGLFDTYTGEGDKLFQVKKRGYLS